MSNMPSFKAREVLDILFRAGFTKVRTSGSHIRLRKGIYSVTLPWHRNRDIPKGTLKSILRQASMTEDEFLSYR